MTKQRALQLAQAYNPDLQIKDILYFLEDAHYQVLAALKRWDALPLPTDISEDDYAILQRAEGWFMVELLAQANLLHMSSGDIQSQTQGKVKIEMQRSIPMFFFGGKDQSAGGDQIASLLSHMTAWQRGQWLIASYAIASTSIDDVFIIVHDHTTRGRGWNHELEDENFA